MCCLIRSASNKEESETTKKNERKQAGLSSPNIVEVDYMRTESGMLRVADAKQAVTNGAAPFPRWRPVMIQGRWRALRGSEDHLDQDETRLISALLQAVVDMRTVADQRDIFYTIRGALPDLTLHGKKLQDCYDDFTGAVMEKVQLLTNETMQSFGVRAGPRGFIWGDGEFETRRGRIDVKSQPALTFDLAAEDAVPHIPAHKVIHFEKAAGFERLTSGDIHTMLEALFTTSQGYLTESASKFLANLELAGLQIFTVHDGDPHGVQMQLMYGLASQKSAYMPTCFYPQNAKPLGLFPKIASSLELPAETVGETHKKIFPNLKVLKEEKPDIAEDVDVIIERLEQWEFQSLNGLSEAAAQLYLVEALRAQNDEIKHVPHGQEIKDEVLRNVESIFSSALEWGIQQAVDKALEKAKKDIDAEIRKALAPQIREYKETWESEVEKLTNIDENEFRETVKQKLCENPKQYADQVSAGLGYEIANAKFDVTTTATVTVDVEDAEAELTANVGELPWDGRERNKDDVVAAIEDQITGGPEPDDVPTRIRAAVEGRFGAPNLEW